MIDVTQRSAALACPNRQKVLRWLKQPEMHFPPQVHGDINEDGVCGIYIADKLGVTRPTASAHMKKLVEAGFVRAKRIGQYTYFKRVETAFAAFSRDLLEL
jgi:DNA-binding transcriptional ArsR family regulator